MELWSILIAACLATLASADESIRFERQADNGCGPAAICRNIRDCPQMIDLLKMARQNRTVQEYLKRSLCGFEGNDPKVCCLVTKDPEENGGDGVRSGGISVLPSPPYCGTSGNLDLPRIVGGKPAELGQWPWMAALGYRAKRGDTKKIQWLCGGALVTQSHVVTAAHCLFHPSLNLAKVRLGDLDLNDNIADGATPVDLDIVKQIPHEKYSKSKFTDDIAILKLERPVQLTRLIQPICLPKTPELRSNSFAKVNPFAAGWGSVQFRGPSSTHLQEIQLPVLDNKVCVDKFRPKGAEIINRQLCAGYLTGGKDACQGDSGGPLMLPRGESFFLIGVVSFGYKCAEVGYPGVYTRTTEYIDWISANVQK